MLLVKARRLPAAEVCHKPSDQVVAESGAVDHLDEEEVRDDVERLRDVHLYGYDSARWLAFRVVPMPIFQPISIPKIYLLPILTLPILLLLFKFIL